MKSRAAATAACLLILALAGCSKLSSSGTPAGQPTSQGHSQGGSGQGQLGQGPGSQPATSAPPVTATPPASASAPASTAPLTSYTVCVTPVVTCQGEMKPLPEQIVLSGDGTAFVSGLTWTGWGQTSATGTGSLKLDNCDPNCAQGGLTSYAATIDLSDLTPYGNGLQAYAQMNVSAPGSSFGSREYDHLVP